MQRQVRGKPCRSEPDRCHADSGDVRIAIGTPADLPANWEEAAGYLIGPEANLNAADLAGANLSDADLTSANLTNADLHGADVTDANFTSAILIGVQSGDLTGSRPTLPDGWSYSAGFLIGPGANLTLADMVNADISEADLDGADLAGWNTGKRAFLCSITPPHTVRAGKSHPYWITATENLGACSHTAPAVGHAVDPEVIYFK
jgi:hypothetical protein